MNHTSTMGQQHVVVVGPTPPPKMVEGSDNRFYAYRPMVSPYLAGIRARWLTGVPLHSTSGYPTSTVCDSDLQRRLSSDGGLSLFKYERSREHLFVLSWARVQRVLWECCFGVVYGEWYGVCDFVVLSVVDVCADYGGVNVFRVCLNFGVCVSVCGVCVVVCCLFLTSGCCLLCCDVA